MKHLSTQIHHYLVRAKKVVIVPHQNPDGDAIGAATALHEYLKNRGQESVIFCVTPVQEKLHFVPNSKTVITDPAVFKEAEVEAIVVLDSGDLRYAGVDKLLAGHAAKLINIDHHATNEHYGHINLVIPTASSTSEILYHFFRHNHIAISGRMATSLLTGLLTDTGNFTNAATSASALEATGELLRAGGNFNLVNFGTLKNKSVGSLRLWGKVLGRLNTDARLNLTYTYLTQTDIVEHGVSDAESEGIANFLNNLESTDIALILKETPDGKIKGSFRTTKEGIDVSAMAKKLGGGGHKKAAGFSTEGTIKEVLNKILTA